EFAPRTSLESKMVAVEATVRAVASGDAGPLADQMARLYAEYNNVHPFREGNGRTGTTVLHIVASLRGRRLDLSRFSRDEWDGASRDPVRSGPGTGTDHRPLVQLFVRALD